MGSRIPTAPQSAWSPARTPSLPPSEALLAATEADLAKVAAAVSSGRLRAPGKIGLRAGRVLHRHKLAKQVALEIAEGHFAFSESRRRSKKRPPSMGSR